MKLNKILIISSAAGVICFGSPEQDALRRQILETRAAPPVRIDVKTTLYVTDFGAVPNDGENDYPAFAAALKTARTSPAPVEIVFSPGRYNFASDAEINYNDGAFQLTDISDLLIEGSGAEIIINRAHMSLAYAKNATNIIIRNFTVDYDPLPFTQGTVEAVDTAAGAFVLKMDDGFPDPSQPPFTSPEFASFGVVIDPQTGLLKDYVTDHFLISKREGMDGGRVRLSLQDVKVAGELNAGDRFVLNCRAGAMARAFDTENITLQNITAYAIPGCFVQGANLSGVNVVGCKTKRKDNRLIVSGADGIHIQAARVGPWIEGCDFEGLMDDYFIIYNIPNYILEQPSPDRVKVSMQNRVKTGDRLLFFNPRVGEVIKVVTALAVDAAGVQLSEPVTGLMIKPADGTVLPPPKGNAGDVGWKELDYIFNMSTAGENFVVRNNYFHDGRRFGIFVMASYGLIEHNRIERLSGMGLSVFNIPYFPGGFWSRNTIIADNIIEDCGDYSYRIPVRICGFYLGWKKLPAMFHENLFFTGNRISHARLPLAEWSSINGMQVADNSFVSKTNGAPLVSVSQSENLNFSNNRWLLPDGKVISENEAVQIKKEKP